MICYLYTFPNGKHYCGITRNSIEERAHSSKFYQGQRVGFAIAKYGWENIKKEVIFTSEDEKAVTQKEIDTIAQLDLLNPAKGYNVSPGGNYQTPEVRQQISQTIKDLWNQPEYREHMIGAAKQRHHSEDTKQRMSETWKTKFQEHPELCKERSEKLKLAYQNGNREEAIKKSKEAKRQPVAKYADDGTVVAVFPSAIEAYREYCPNATVDKSIYRVLNGTRQHYRGFKYRRISKEEEVELKNGLLRSSNKT